MTTDNKQSVLSKLRGADELSDEELIALAESAGFAFHYDKYTEGSGYGLLSKPYNLENFRALLARYALTAGHSTQSPDTSSGHSEPVAEVQLHPHDASKAIVVALVDFEVVDVGMQLYDAPQASAEAINADWFAELMNLVESYGEGAALNGHSKLTRHLDRISKHAMVRPSTALKSAPAAECWCRTCRPITIADMRMVVCPDCGNKRCPHANDHRNACTGSNEAGQPGSAYPAAEDSAKGVGDVVAWTNDTGDIEPISDALKKARPDLYVNTYTRPLAFADRQQRGGDVDAKFVSQFISDAHTAAGLVSHGKQSKALGERLGNGCMKMLAALAANKANEGDAKIEKQLKESLAYLETLANFGGTIQQARELAQKGVNKLTEIKGKFL